MSSLIPSRQLAFSPGLAAAIGLEEAILLQCLSEESESHPGENQSNFVWYELPQPTFAARLPFWSANDISRIAENLRQKGIILLASPPLNECSYVRFAFNEASAKKAMPHTANQITEPLRGNTLNPPARNQSSTRPITKSWSPDDACFQLLAQQGVPENFARDQIPEFIHYWSERGEARHAWGNRFVTQVLRRWREYEARKNREQREALATNDIPSWAEKTSQANQTRPMDRHWKPSNDALEILEIQAGIHRSFIEEAIPEFILYWLETGRQENTWNTKFIKHVKTRWAYHTHEIENKTTPKPITKSWRPRQDTIEHLQQYENVSLQFMEVQLSEFIIYWIGRNELRPSWDSVFLTHVKKQSLKKTTEESATTSRDRTIAEDLTDRSWAS